MRKRAQGNTFVKHAQNNECPAQVLTALEALAAYTDGWCDASASLALIEAPTTAQLQLTGALCAAHQKPCSGGLPQRRGAALGVGPAVGPPALWPTYHPTGTRSGLVLG